jgi:molecular chaperone GrpE
MENDPKTALEESGETAADAEETAADAEETAAAEEEVAEEITKLLEDARSKADEHWDNLLRLRAEMDNLGKRHARELENAHKFALDNFVRELLQVWDSLELGHSAAQDDQVDVAKLRDGTELTLKLFGDVMSKFGVERIDPIGEPFNPEFHQAMTLQPRDDMEPNHVASVVQKGVSLNGRLVRPAMVIVSQASS